MLQAFHAVYSKGAGNLLLFGDAIAPNEDFPASAKSRHRDGEYRQSTSRPARNRCSRAITRVLPSYLASKPERFSYIHFVAHGTASRLSPLDSAIVLSRANAAR